MSSLPNKALHYWYLYTIMHRSIFRNTFLLFVLVINITFSKGENDNENDNENENDNQRQVYDFEEDCLGIPNNFSKAALIHNTNTFTDFLNTNASYSRSTLQIRPTTFIQEYTGSKLSILKCM